MTVMAACRKVYMWKRSRMMIYINATTSMPAKPATATCAEFSEAALLPSSLTPGTADADEDEPEAEAEAVPVDLAV